MVSYLVVGEVWYYGYLAVGVVWYYGWLPSRLVKSGIIVGYLASEVGDSYLAGILVLWLPSGW